MKAAKWLQMGYRYKRWLVSGIIGVLFMAAAVLLLLKDVAIGPIQLSVSIVLTALGVVSLFICLKTIFVKFLSVYSAGLLRRPANVKEIGDILYRRKILALQPRMVVIGGGTGSSTLLRGLKQYTSNITAIITVADDGGGSGVLRSDLGMLPPGDIRNCMLALAETEPVLEKLLNYRFKEGRLKGQSFGNLFLAAMCGISDSFEQAVTHMSQVLAVTGRIYPVTEEDVTLVAELSDGAIIHGESQIGEHHMLHPAPIRRVYYDREGVKPLKQVIEAISEADVIVLGPGSLYTSIIPNLIVDDVSRAIEKSRALKVYVCNVMTQPGETEGYTAADHVEAIHKHAGCDLIDYCLVNSGGIEPSILQKYRDDGAEPVAVDGQRLWHMGLALIEKDLVRIKNDYVRHDPDKLAKAILDIYKMNG